MLQTDHLRSNQLESLVENRTTYNLRSVALNLFETHTAAAAVELQFAEPVLASMIRGKKVMHLRSRPGFAFLPGESVLLPPGERMKIDFPDATDGTPTKCLALEIDRDAVDRTLRYMNEERPREEMREWTKTDYNFHFTHDAAVTQLIQRLVFLCAEDHPSKDLFVDMHLRELLIRILETESRDDHLLHATERATSSGIDYVIDYVRNHLSEKITVAQLSRLACMSESSFYRTFRHEMGRTPVEFINAERLRLAAHLLLGSERSVRDIALRCGFNSPAYFTRAFKQGYGNCPVTYRDRNFSG